MNLQLLVVVLCVLAALVFLLRPWLMRWTSARSGAGAGGSTASQGGACGGCKGCGSRSSGGCH
ncbi:hypothetical protein [Hydrogenophaga sp.]|uniref:hypothetical protein n=1 Tax=Hydrogenophaga sp. TaxID=1904254 RepID=UPI0035AF580B